MKRENLTYIYIVIAVLLAACNLFLQTMVSHTSGEEWGGGSKTSVIISIVMCVLSIGLISALNQPDFLTDSAKIGVFAGFVGTASLTLLSSCMGIVLAADFYGIIDIPQIYPPGG